MVVVTVRVDVFFSIFVGQSVSNIALSSFMAEVCATHGHTGSFSPRGVYYVMTEGEFSHPSSTPPRQELAGSMIPFRLLRHSGRSQNCGVGGVSGGLDGMQAGEGGGVSPGFRGVSEWDELSGGFTGGCL